MVDTATNTMTATISVGTNPVGVGFATTLVPNFTLKLNDNTTHTAHYHF